MAAIKEAEQALMIAKGMQEEINQILSPLSDRETEILSLVARGHTDRVIAQSLCLVLQTVRNHTHSAIGKCKAKNRTHAVAIALQHGWITFEEAE